MIIVQMKQGWPFVMICFAKLHDRLSWLSLSNQRRKKPMGLPNICLCTKISRKVKTWSIQFRPRRKLVWCSSIHISRVLGPRERIMPADSLREVLTKLVVLRNLFPFQVDPRSFIKFDVNTWPRSLMNDGDSPCGPAVVCVLRKLILLIKSISDGGPVSAGIGTVASISGRPTVAAGQINWSHTYSAQPTRQRSWEWTSVQSDSLITSFTPGFRGPALVISR